MAQLTQVEVNSIREVASCHQTVAAKFNTYAQQCTDPQIKQMFQKAGQDATQSAQKLIQLL